jgi:iron complex outermembrane recepter protein
MKRILLSAFFCLTTYLLYSQQMVTGTVLDAVTGEGLVNAVVVIDDGKLFTNCNVEGKYKVILNDGEHVLQVKYVGYKCEPVKIKVEGKPIVVDIPCSNGVMTEVQIIADVAIDRQTPVAFSNINETRLKEEAGGRDITMMMNSTPGAYATEQGGGAGDSRVNLRGADQRNVGVMVDGVPMNDMENGQVFWSNWDGLTDVTRTMQVQRGLGASRLAIPSVGGTINVLTRGIDQRQSFTFQTGLGNNNMQKMYFGFNSGEIGKGWGITLAGTRRTQEGWVTQTWSDQYAYFAKLQKRLDNHLFSLSTNAAPQSHGQRSERMPIGVLDRSFAEGLGVDVDSIYATNIYTTRTQGERGMQYNPNWGFVQYDDGQLGLLNQSINFYNKPLYNFSWYWTPNEKLSISTVSYLSKGFGGGTNFNSTINRDTLTGQLNITQTYLSNSTAIDNLYSSTENKSSRALLASMNNHIWYGAISTATWKPNDKFTYLFGLDVRHYKGEHYRMVYDLVGGDYFIDASNKNQPNGVGNLQYSMKRKGDKVGFHNESSVNWGGAFGQVEYAGDKWSAFMTLTASVSQYQRFDYFKKKDIILEDGTVVNQMVGYNEVYYTNGTEDALAQNGAVITNFGDTTIIDNPSGLNDTIVGAKSYAWSSSSARTATTEKKTFPGFTIKTGANYNINDNYNVFMNIGYMNIAPRFNTVFDNNNREYPNVKQQQVYAAEMGFGARYSAFAANLNLYYTQWLNKAPYSSPTVSVAGDPFTYDLTGLNTNLMGVEFDFNWKVLSSLQLEGLISLGNWTYQSSGSAYLYDSNYELEDTINYSAKGVHLGDAAQTQLGAAIRWEPFTGFYVKPRYTYFGRNYANFDPIVLTPVYNNSYVQVGDNSNRESWRMPGYGLLDLNFGYEFRQVISKEENRTIRMGLTFNITNVLNTVYLTDATNGLSFDANSALVHMGMGRRWTTGLRISF